MVVTLLSEGSVTSHGTALFTYSPKVKEEGVFCAVQAPRLRASKPQAVAQYPEH
jgi:hypothetical protein